MSAGLLRMRAVSRSFGAKRVLDAIDLSVAPGEIAVLVGASGSGKTTLLRIVAGLERADTGQVWLRGRCVDAGEASRAVPPERRRLGMVFQEHALWPHLSAAENVALALPRDTRDPAAQAHAWLAAVALAGLERRKPPALSGGQQQRVALARALASGSELVLLDEPLSSLDEIVRDRLRPLIRDRLRAAGRAALLVSHDRLDAWRMADRVLVLENGRLVQAGTPPALYVAPATDTVARYMGAVGQVAVRGVSPDGVVIAATGVPLACRSVVPPGAPGLALAYPEATRLAPAGLAATCRDTVFEAGSWRTRWQIGALDDELIASHAASPPASAHLEIAGDRCFAYPISQRSP